jgi:hypothetical protein
LQRILYIKERDKKDEIRAFAVPGHKSGNSFWMYIVCYQREGPAFSLGDDKPGGLALGLRSKLNKNQGLLEKWCIFDFSNRCKFL